MIGSNFTKKWFDKIITNIYYVNTLLSNVYFITNLKNATKMPACKLTTAISQSVSNATVTQLGLEVVDFDTKNNMAETGSAGIRIQENGIYNVGTHLGFENSGSYEKSIYIRVNNIVRMTSVGADGIQVGGRFVLELSSPLELFEGDLITMWCYQASGSTSGIYANAPLMNLYAIKTNDL